MTINLKSFVLVIATVLLSFQIARAEEQKKGGWLRERIKDRWVKKQEQKPAPQADSKVETKIESSGTFTFTLLENDLARFYKVHVPSTYKSESPTPLLVALHGGGGDMEIQSTDEYYKLISKSESAGFIVAFPNGYSKLKSGKFATWNAGRCCGDARDKKIDDVGFIKAMISKLKIQLNIDSNRVFLTGMSNGAMMSYRLACEAPEIFAAIAAIAGTDNTAECASKTPLSVLHIHAKDDTHVLFNGGAGKDAFKDRSQVTEFTSVASSVAKWTKLNGCEGTAEKVIEKAGAYCEIYSKCKNGVKVQLCVTETGGHSWPGGKKPRNTGTKPSSAISANDVMWDFFRSVRP